MSDGSAMMCGACWEYSMVVDGGLVKAEIDDFDDEQREVITKIRQLVHECNTVEEILTYLRA